jgi:ASC-1-like (ASCH) protein
MISLFLLHQYFELIRLGLKTVEGRIDTKKFEVLQPGDKISFTSTQTQDTLICIVKYIHRYNDFESMLIHEGIENMLPGVKDLKEGVAIYESLPEYKEKVKKIGAVAIKIERLE